jgi:hypothetical protein
MIAGRTKIGRVAVALGMLLGSVLAGGAGLSSADAAILTAFGCEGWEAAGSLEAPQGLTGSGELPAQRPNVPSGPHWLPDEGFVPGMGAPAAGASGGLLLAGAVLPGLAMWELECQACGLAVERWRRIHARDPGCDLLRPPRGA